MIAFILQFGYLWGFFFWSGGNWCSFFHFVVNYYCFLLRQCFHGISYHNTKDDVFVGSVVCLFCLTVSCYHCGCKRGAIKFLKNAPTTAYCASSGRGVNLPCILKHSMSYEKPAKIKRSHTRIRKGAFKLLV